MAEPRVLVVSCFFSSDSLVEETVRVLGSTTDLLLVPIEPEAPVPASAEPFLVTTKLGLAPEDFQPCRKWSAITRVLDHVDPSYYDFAFFPDDDLEYGDDFANIFFPLLQEWDLAVAQPSLTPDSFHTWDVCVQDPSSLVRFTNFVEVMAPCFRRDALALLRPTLAGDISPMGYGFDLHWGYPCGDAGLNMGIVDATTIAHRFRPTGKHYAGDDLHGQGIAYGRHFPRILPHEIATLRTVPRERT